MLSFAPCSEICLPHLSEVNKLYTRLAMNLILVDYKNTVQES